jgi:uncharacterized protein (UPF0335 family)
MLTLDVDDKPTVVTITSDDAKKLSKALKGRKKAAAEKLERMEADDVVKAASEKLEQMEADAGVVKPAATNKQLLAFIERVENVELELAERSEDRKQIYAEARSCGFDVPTLKKIVALRKMDDDDRLAAEALLATYMHAVGMAVQTEMGF